ncbi:MAG: GntR family transcriptional regulator [Verrucomicrobiales bacterium]|jgi:DNA-binding GntR family transcriptional regulator|nr:GntR family transcriptional regulator [Verrucomicrobiales bacterium]MBP9224395.1 GntR family transcriptional regulator [Verrucomicrobiales bacterium]HQZ26808.1 GntR family transcriptional regulator [Verrucomicrobiales bacterium]
MPPSTLSLPQAIPSSRNSPLHLRAYEEIKQLIVSGEFPPDSFLSERQLALRLGMSKTPVHIALKRIEAEGFVIISPQQGIVVRGLAPGDILDHYELREAIEGFVVRKLAGKLSDAQITTLRQALAEQKKALQSGFLARSLELDADFHLTLATFLGNLQILATMEQLRDKIRLVILRVSSLHRARFEESVREHELIVDHLIAGRPEAAEQALIDHLEAGKRQILSPANRFLNQ